MWRKLEDRRKKASRREKESGLQIINEYGKLYWQLCNKRAYLHCFIHSRDTEQLRHTKGRQFWFYFVFIRLHYTSHHDVFYFRFNESQQNASQKYTHKFVFFVQKFVVPYDIIQVKHLKSFTQLENLCNIRCVCMYNENQPCFFMRQFQTETTPLTFVSCNQRHLKRKLMDYNLPVLDKSSVLEDLIW